MDEGVFIVRMSGGVSIENVGARSLDDVVRPRQHGRWDGEAEGLRYLEVDDEAYARDLARLLRVGDDGRSEDAGGEHDNEYDPAEREHPGDGITPAISEKGSPRRGRRRPVLEGVAVRYEAAAGDRRQE